LRNIAIIRNSHNFNDEDECVVNEYLDSKEFEVTIQLRKLEEEEDEII